MDRSGWVIPRRRACGTMVSCELVSADAGNLGKDIVGRAQDPYYLLTLPAVGQAQDSGDRAVAVTVASIVRRGPLWAPGTHCICC